LVFTVVDVQHQYDQQKTSLQSTYQRPDSKVTQSLSDLH
jgi:hypothetical protein